MQAKNLEFTLREEKEPAGRQLQSPTFTIPVVFHILHKGGNENISDAQVTDAVSILTRDFNRMNADTSDVTGPFKQLIGDGAIAFALAKKDPSGNCTNGIIRHWDDNTHWVLDTGTAGNYAYTWPAHQYLNVYVVKSFNDPLLGGYSSFPGWFSGNEDVIVMRHAFVGSIGTGNVSSSRVLTHEVGHWLGLEHPWGWSPSPGMNCGDDGIADTPVTMGYFGCSLGNAAICNPPIVENVQNYMDYSSCPRMFTHGQVFAMQNTLMSPAGGRDNLSQPGNLSVTGITSPGTQCLPHLAIAAFPSATLCSGSAITLASYTSNAAATGYTWSSNGSASFSSPNSSSTTAQFNTPGIYTVACVASGSAGSVSQVMNLKIESGQPQVTGIYMEPFEQPGTQLPAGWATLSGWQKTGLASASDGTSCAYLPGTPGPPGAVHILQTPSYDFKNNPGARFTFRYAYARKSSGTTDRFKVQASRDCGGTWTDVYVPGMHVLANGSGGIQQNDYIPLTWHWKRYDLTGHPAFGPFAGQSNVRFRFWYSSDSSGLKHRFFLDEINFEVTTGLDGNHDLAGLSVFPNPVTDVVCVESEDLPLSRISWELLDITGRELGSAPVSEYRSRPGRTEISTQNLSSGIYLLRVRSGGKEKVLKLIKE